MNLDNAPRERLLRELELNEKVREQMTIENNRLHLRIEKVEAENAGMKLRHDTACKWVDEYHKKIDRLEKQLEAAVYALNEDTGSLENQEAMAKIKAIGG